jgi:hypothetical protein
VLKKWSGAELVAHIQSGFNGADGLYQCDLGNLCRIRQITERSFGNNRDALLLRMVTD